MVKVMAEELRRIMDKKNNIRNISVFAHVDHGKSTLTESLMVDAGIVSHEIAGDVCMTDTGADGAEHGMTIKSMGISLYYQMTDESLKTYSGDRDGNEYLLNLIDSPGHVDLSSEVATALCLTDGALVVVDCVEGVCVQTETVLHQAIGERVRPVPTVDRMDRLFLEFQGDGEAVYHMLSRIIETTNAIIASCNDKLLGDFQVYPEKGTVAFSAGLHGWAFNLSRFAKMYASKFEVDESKMVKRLWGENFFDSNTKKWTPMNTGSATCKRGFVQFCYEPIKQIISICMNNQKDKLWPMLQKLKVTIRADVKELTGEDLMKRVMQTWLPESGVLLEMMISHLPSPAKAQKYRVEKLYEGPLDDIYATAIRNCDPEGPLMLYVSKMIPASSNGSSFAFGRVFSGRVAGGMKVRIMGPNYVPDQNKDLYTNYVQRSMIWMGNKQENVADVPCGNTVSLFGLDKFITETATLTNNAQVNAWLLRPNKLSVLPVMSICLQCKYVSYPPKFLELKDRTAQPSMSSAGVDGTIQSEGISQTPHMHEAPFQVVRPRRKRSGYADALASAQDKDDAKLFRNFLKSFERVGDKEKFYVSEVGPLVSRGSIRVMDIFYVHLLEFKRDLAMRICNGFKRLIPHLTEEGQGFMEELGFPKEKNDLKLKFHDLPQRHQAFENVLQQPGILSNMAVRGHNGKPIKTPNPEILVKVQRLVHHIFGKHTAGFSWEGNIGLEDIEMIDDRIVIRKDPKFISTDSQKKKKFISTGISESLIDGIQKDCKTIDRLVLSKFSSPGSYVAFLVPLRRILSGTEANREKWSDPVKAERFREFILHFPFFKRSIIRANLMSGIHNACDSHDPEDEVAKYKNELKNESTAKESWMSAVRISRNELLIGTLNYEIEMQKKDPKVTGTNLQQQVEHYREDLESLTECLRNHFEHDTERTFDEEHPRRIEGSSGIIKSKRKPRTQLLRSLDELELGASCALEKYIVEVLAILSDSGAINTGLLKTVWEAYKSSDSSK